VDAGSVSQEVKVNEIPMTSAKGIKEADFIMFQVDKTQQYTTKNKKGLVKYFTDRLIQVKEGTILSDLVLFRGNNLAQ
jgi:hypothetical protein